MSKLRLALAVVAGLVSSCGSKGPAGPQGPQGAQGPAGPGFMAGASISAVSPTEVAVGRTQVVSISGFATEWTSAATASFGAGTHVTKTVVASPTGLLVTLAVDATATPGTRDVTVNQGGATTTYKGAFKILPSVSGTFLGTAYPGSVSLYRLDANDPSWDLGGFPNLTFSPTGLVNTLSTNNGTDFYEAALSTDVLTDDGGTPAGPVDVSLVLNSGSVNERKFTAPGAFSVTAASYTPISVGSPVNGMIANPYESATYTVDLADGGAQLDVSVTGDPGTTVSVLPPSGQWSSKIFTGTSGGLLPSVAGTYYFTVWNGAGATGNYTLGIAAVPSETEPNDTTGAANTLALPGAVSAALGTLTDVDYFKVTVSAADVGKSVHVKTSAGDVYTDTVVDVFDSTGTNSLGGPSSDGSFHEDFTSSPTTAAGDYYVKVYYSTYVMAYDPTASHYLLHVELK
jgi:hypothetical protein